MPNPTVYDLIDLLEEICTGTSDSKHHAPIDSIRFGILISLAGPLGLLGNLASILSVADPWRVNESTRSHVGDKFWVLLINAFALFFGCLSNVLLAFVRNTLWVVSASYFIAVLLYISLFISTEYVYFKNSNFTRSFGYWQAVAACSQYFISAVLSGAHAVHARKRNSRCDFSPKFKRMVLLCAVYIAYIAVGGAAFSARTMLDVSFADGVYFTVVTCLTLGYGDIVPSSNLSKALDLPYIYAGLVLGGLVTYAVFTVAISHSRAASVLDTVDRKRHKIIMNKTFKTSEESFHLMRSIVDKCDKRSKMWRAVFTMCLLFALWFVGAMVFMFTEDWNYFQALYMAAVSLSSVGYGEFVPQSPGGKTFLIHWALLALPTVATAVSDIYSLIYVYASTKDVEYLHKKKHKQEDMDKKRQHHHMSHKFEKRFEFNDSPSRKVWDLVYRILQRENYCYDVWDETISLLFYPNEVPKNFWVSEHSPLRNPCLNERRFLLLATAYAISDFSYIEKLDH